MYKTILFDLDGTLVDTAPSIIQGIKITLTKYGYEIPDAETLRKCVGPPFTYSFPKLLGISDEDFAGTVATYRQWYDKEDGLFNAEVYPGIVELLEDLVKRGYNLMVCTSKPEPTAIKLLTHLGIDKYFTKICGATLDAKIDTKAEVIELCFTRAPWMNKSETVLIGDTKFDIIGAKAAGLDSIGISWGSGLRQELENEGATIVLDSCKEVSDYIESC